MIDSSSPSSTDLMAQIQKKIRMLQNGEYQNVKCIKNAKASLVCINEKCTKHVFTCQSSKKCQCYVEHKNCVQVSLESLFNSLSFKIQAFNPIKQTIFDFIDKSIEYLSNYKCQLQKEMMEKYEKICLNQDQRNFIKSLQTGDFKGLSSKNMFSTCYQSRFIAKMDENINKINRTMQKTWQVFQKQLDTLSINFKIDLEECIFSQQQKKFSKSQIITNFKQTMQICKFFDQKIKSVKILYRASQNAFGINQFFEKCSNIRNTLTLIKTEGNKIIGGYNPLIWIKPDKDEYIKDDSGKSFIFSLSDNQKFSLLKKENAIRKYPNYGPMWGAGDIYIYDKADSNTSSSAYICNTYTNDKYKQNNTILYDKFHGGQKGTCYFKIKQWQVWQILFE